MKFLVSSLIGLVLSVSVNAESLLEGRVRLSSGEPAAGVQVRLFDLTDLRRSVGTMTDETGHFALPLRAFSTSFASAGTYYIRVHGLSSGTHTYTLRVQSIGLTTTQTHNRPRLRRMAGLVPRWAVASPSRLIATATMRFMSWMPMAPIKPDSQEMPATIRLRFGLLTADTSPSRLIATATMRFT